MKIQNVQEKFKYFSLDLVPSNSVIIKMRKSQNYFNKSDLKYQKNISKIKEAYQNQHQFRSHYNIDHFGIHSQPAIAKYHSSNRISQEPIQFKSIQKKRSSVLRDKMIKQYGNSPYLKNIKDFDKIQRMMTPAKQPTQSIKLQIKRHNHTSHNIRNHQNVILRNNQNFQQKLETFLKRLGLTKNCKTFIMNSKDFHIKQELIFRGWKELEDRDSAFFHLKWVYIDKVADYSKLHSSQFYNHFCNNQELTNKNNLRKNIKRLSKDYRPSLPLTYDLGLSQDYQDFQQSYFQFKCISILKQLVDLISKSNSQYYDKIINNKNYFKHQRYSHTKNEQTHDKKLSQVFKVKLKKKSSIHIHGDKFNNQQKLKTSQGENYLLKDSKDLSINQKKFIQHFLLFLSYMTKSLQTKTGIVYSIFTFDHKSSLIWKDSKHLIIKLIQQKIFTNLELNQIIQKLSSFFIVQIVKIYFHFKKLFQSNYGFQNIWIIKPVGVSRGAGISIKNDYYQIASNKHAKIVQKYIQKPLLLKCQRKFDIRQWVLVRHFQPLEVYIFKNCYCRMSSQKYCPEQFENLPQHLTNFSLSKQIYKKNGLNSILLESDLTSYLGNQIWKLVKNQIKCQILKTLKCCEHQIAQNSQNNFEIYGFDIMLDQAYKPWIIQVNMSPACESREGLDKYLRDMAIGIVDMLQKKPISNWELIDENLLQNEAKNEKQKQLKSESASKICRFLRRLKYKV